MSASWMLWWWLGFGVAGAVDDAHLAPSLERLEASLERSRTLLSDAEASLARMSDGQSEWVQEGCVRSACSLAVGAELLATVRDAGHEARDLVQSARMEVGRARRMADGPTVWPLLDERRRTALLRLESDVDRAARAWLVRTSWYDRYMGGWAWNHRWSLKDLCVTADAAIETP